MIPEAVFAPLRELVAMQRLGQHGPDLVYLDCPFVGGERCLEVRARFLAAMVRHYAPLRLLVADPEGDAADLDRLGLAVDGPARVVTAATDLVALDDVSLHVGAWLLYRSRHQDLRDLLGEHDPIRTPILGELLRRGDVDAVIASFWHDREWIIGLR